MRNCPVAAWLCVLALVGMLVFPAVAGAQTFVAALTDPAAKDKDAEQVRATATFTVDAPKETIEFSVFLRSPIVTVERVSVNLGTPSQPGPAIFIFVEGELQNPIQGVIHRGAEIVQPEEGIEDWGDAIKAITQNKVFLKVETPSYPVFGLAGNIRRQ